MNQTQELMSRLGVLFHLIPLRLFLRTKDCRRLTSTFLTRQFSLIGPFFSVQILCNPYFFIVSGSRSQSLWLQGREFTPQTGTSISRRWKCKILTALELCHWNANSLIPTSIGNYCKYEANIEQLPTFDLAITGTVEPIIAPKSCDWNVKYRAVSYFTSWHRIRLISLAITHTYWLKVWNNRLHSNCDDRDANIKWHWLCLFKCWQKNIPASLISIYYLLFNYIHFENVEWLTRHNLTTARYSHSSIH